MYRVIIADDESAVRERLLALLKKESNGFEVVGSFENGYDALEAIESLQPDLLITDIKMPYINGIELIKQAKVELPLLQSIIISGYDSFDYAKQAIDLGVIGYMSKPISNLELQENLVKAKNTLDTQVTIDKNISNLQKQVETSLKVLQESDLMRLITLKEVSINMHEKLLNDGINLDCKYHLLAIFDTDQDLDTLSNEKFELFRFYVSKYFHEQFDRFINSYDFADGQTHVFLLCSDKIINKEEMLTKFNETIAMIKKACDVSVSVGVSDISKDNEISYRKLYRHAKRCLEYRTVVGSNIVLFFDDLENHTNIKTPGKIDENEYKTISYDILYGKEEEAKESIKHLVTTISSKEYTDSYYFILNNILDTILKSCINLSKLYINFMPHIEIVQKLYGSKTSQSIISFFDDLIEKVSVVNESSRLSGVELSFEQIKKYIDSHYYESTLSLECVANELCYSVSYISAILKKNNTSFTKYLTDIRMEKAKALLADNNNKLITIASAVGYEDPYYFSHCFKKYYGVSPIEYRKK